MRKLDVLHNAVKTKYMFVFFCMLCDCIGQQRPTWNGAKGQQWVSTLHWTVVSKLIPMYQVWWQLNGVCIQNVLEQKKAAPFGLFMRSTPLHLPPPRTSESFSKMKSNSFSVTSGVKVLVMQTRTSIQISNPIWLAEHKLKKQKQNKNDSSEDSNSGKDSVSEHKSTFIAFRLTQGCQGAECLSYPTFYTHSVVFLWPGVGLVNFSNQELSSLTL